MRRILAFLFVFSVNFLLLVSYTGLLQLGTTLLFGPWPSRLPTGLTILALILSLLYPFVRAYFPWQSPGEIWLGNADKANLRRQTHGFTVTRIPLMVLVVLTLLLNSNLPDGADDEATLRLPDVLLLAAVLGTQLYAVTAFLARPRLLPVLLLATVLFGLGLAFRLGYQILMAADLDELPRTFVVTEYALLGVLWLLLGWFYARRHVLTAATARPVAAATSAAGAACASGSRGRAGRCRPPGG